MELKQYQVAVLERAKEFLQALAARRKEATEFAAFKQAQGSTVGIQPFCATAWGDVSSSRVVDGNISAMAAWVSRVDGLGRDVPHVCIKVPTGGGKTLLACHTVGIASSIYLESQTGLIVWVVPSDAILQQTITRISTKGHPYRNALDAAAGGRVLVFRKGDTFTARDVAENLCILVIMLQSTARNDNEVLKVFRDAGGFSSFFPAVDDDPANEQLIKKVKNLDRINLVDKGIPGTVIRHSLANVVRLCRPILVIDEGHRAYTDLARDSLLNLNPSFTLELTATPNVHGHRSNVLVSVTGIALKSEDMIKLPINVYNLDGETWQGAVKRGLDITRSLTTLAEKEQRQSGRYVRPIMVVRVEATGGDRKDKSRIHADHVREFLETRASVPKERIRTKTAYVDEIGDDDLLARDCAVQIILTKDALREGWDCSFAYVLVLLSSTTAPTAITQMIGRVLRQPDGLRYATSDLNESHVVCRDQEVQDAVAAVREGLEAEGMVDLGGEVRIGARAASQATTIKAHAKRHPGLLLLPIVAMKSEDSGWRAFSRERDLLPKLDWQSFKFRRTADLAFDRTLVETTLAIALHDVGGALGMTVDSRSREVASLVPPGLAPAVLHLLDVVPNVWQAVRIIQEVEGEILARGVALAQLKFMRPYLAEEIRRDMEDQVDIASESIFKTLVASKHVALVSSVKSGVGFPLPSQIDVSIPEQDQLLLQRNGKPLYKNAFQKIYKSMANSLETAVIRELDSDPRIKWWCRVPVHGGWALSGWRSGRVYPDLIAEMETAGRSAFVILETKGAHLEGNADTTYKRELLEVLPRKIVFEGKQSALGTWRGQILDEANWESELVELLKEQSN